MSTDTITEDSDYSVSDTDAIIYGESDISGRTQSLISDPNISNSSSSSEDEYQQQQISTAAAVGGDGNDDLITNIPSDESSTSARLGGHAVDGCDEFLPSPTADSSDPTSLKWAACGYHRSFHRREPEEPVVITPLRFATAVLEYQPHHRHHPPPPLSLPRGDHSSPNFPSPPPISSSYYPCAPHMLLALSAVFSGEKNPNPMSAPVVNSNGRKRFRTKFTPDQKVKMLEFSERVGWKMPKRDEDLVNNFCSEIGVKKMHLKVWMRNNKNTFGKKSDEPISGDGAGDDENHHHHHQNGYNTNNFNDFMFRYEFDSYCNMAHLIIQGDHKSQR